MLLERIHMVEQLWDGHLHQAGMAHGRTTVCSVSMWEDRIWFSFTFFLSQCSCFCFPPLPGTVTTGTPLGTL